MESLIKISVISTCFKNASAAVGVIGTSDNFIVLSWIFVIMFWMVVFGVLLMYCDKLNK